jgi:uncharacterized protein (DUF58 family)
LPGPAQKKDASGGRRFSVRPTARGWQLVVFGVLALLGGWLVGTTQLYQLGYALLLLLPGALILGLVLLRGLRYERRPSSGERLVAGQESALEVVILNEAARRSPPLEVLDRLPDERLFRARPVPPRSRVSVEAPVRFRRRGVYALGPAEVLGRDPFGILRFAARFERRDEVVVYPRTFDLQDFPVLGGGPEAGSRGILRRGDEFSGLREYRQGDDRRHIHWKSVARTGELVVKEFVEDAPRRFAVALDLRRWGARSSEAEVEDAVSAAGSVLRYLHGLGLPSRLILNDSAGGKTGFGTGEAHLWGAMRLLATARTDGDGDLGRLLVGMRERDASGEGLGEGLVIVGRGLGGDDGLVGAVRSLRVSGLQVVVVAVATPTYAHRGAQRSEGLPKREMAFWGAVERLEAAGAAVRVVEREGGVAAFANGASAGRSAAGVAR